MAVKPTGSSRLIFVSGGGGLSFRLCGATEVLFWVLHGESTSRAGFVEALGASHGRFAFFLISATGVEKMNRRVVGLASVAGFCYWAAIFGGSEGVCARVPPLLRALMMKSPMFDHRSKSVLIGVSRRRLMRLQNKVRASSTQIGDEFRRAGVWEDDECERRCVMYFAFWSLCCGAVISTFFRDLFACWGCTCCFRK
jgi:hypothetical protein